MKHKHWIFIACDEIAGKKFVAGAEVTVNDAQNEEEALLEVKKIIKRKIYTLTKVFECTQCFYEDRKVKAIEKMAIAHDR